MSLFVKAFVRSGMDCVSVVIDRVLLSMTNVACHHGKSRAVSVEFGIFRHLLSTLNCF